MKNKTKYFFLLHFYYFLSKRLLVMVDVEPKTRVQLSISCK